MYLFSDLDEVRGLAHAWIAEYDEERPHTSLGKLTPREIGLVKNEEHTNIYCY